VKILYLDCFSGAAGDMLLGALIDAGVPVAEVRQALGSLTVSADTVWTERVTRAGVTATKFCVRGEGQPESGRELVTQHRDATRHTDAGHDRAVGLAHDQDRGHAHRHADPGEPHEHRTLAQIAELIDGSALSATGKARAKQLFTTLGETEAAIHGVPLERVHLHEVGALDSIIDIVGTVFALERLAVERVIASPLNVGSGSIRTAHGHYPVPAPATARLLKGVPVYAGPQQAEMVTPTGALLVTAYAQEYGPIPAMRIAQIGYGAGSRDFAQSPNVLRVLLGESDRTAAIQTVVVLEAEIDDMNPQIFGLVMDRLLADGALDVFYTPIQMKKGRPGTLVTVIAPPDARERLTSFIFRETTTIGIRYREMARECLDRETVVIDTSLGPIRFKIARRNGEVMNAAAEFDDCVRLAAQHKVPAKHVQALATQAYLDAKNRGL
jgi:pyridinium-3,5-bisthiocarboxylic acid mononucleotide nickel chelatase